ncbi:MAG: SRPBCC family protein [Marmoricola sp.]
MNAPTLEDTVRIDASPATVWALVSDVCKMHEWSPQVDSTRLRAGFDAVALGTQFTNRNSLGELEWTTHAEVVRFEPEREIAFRVEENWVIWSFTVEPDGSGTLLTQRRDAPDGISELSLELTNGFMGGVEVFTESMRAGMRETLDRIKEQAEA